MLKQGQRGRRKQGPGGGRGQKRYGPADHWFLLREVAAENNPVKVVNRQLI